MGRFTLFLKDEKSDNVYQVATEPENDGYMVRFAFGRKGAKLTSARTVPSRMESNAIEVSFDSQPKACFQKNVVCLRTRVVKRGIHIVPTGRLTPFR